MEFCFFEFVTRIRMKMFFPECEKHCQPCSAYFLYRAALLIVWPLLFPHISLLPRAWDTQADDTQCWYPSGGGTIKGAVQTLDPAPGPHTKCSEAPNGIHLRVIKGCKRFWMKFFCGDPTTWKDRRGGGGVDPGSWGRVQLALCAFFCIFLLFPKSTFFCIFAPGR